MPSDVLKQPTSANANLLEEPYLRADVEEFKPVSDYKNPWRLVPDLSATAISRHTIVSL